MKKFVSRSLSHLGYDRSENGKVQKSTQDLFDAIDANDGAAVKKILGGRGPKQDLLMTATRCEMHKTAEELAQAKIDKWFRRKDSPRHKDASAIEGDVRLSVGGVHSAFTPFHLASRDGQAGILEQLFDSVIPSNSKKGLLCNRITNSVDRLTPLHLAVYSPLRNEGKRHEKIPLDYFLSGRLCKLGKDGNRHKSVDVLLRNGADVDMQGAIQGLQGIKCYGTALHMACLNYCDVTTIELLLQRGASVRATVHAPNEPYIHGSTALHLVAHIGIHHNEPRALEALKLLLAAGANAAVTNPSGTVLHQIAGQGLGQVSFDMAEVLVSWSPKARTNLSADSENHWFTPLELLTQRHDCPTALVRILCPGDTFATRRALLSLITSYEKFKAEALAVMLECGVKPNLPVHDEPWVEQSQCKPGETCWDSRQESLGLLDELRNGWKADPVHHSCNSAPGGQNGSDGHSSSTVEFQKSFRERLLARSNCHESDIQAKQTSSDDEDFRFTESEPLVNTLVENGIALESENPPPVMEPHQNERCDEDGTEVDRSITTSGTQQNHNQGPQSCWVWLLAAMAGHLACDVEEQDLKEIFVAFCSVPGHIPYIPVTLNGLKAACSPMYFALRFLDVPFVVDSLLRRQITTAQCFVKSSQGVTLWENPIMVLMQREDLSPESEELTALISYILKVGGEETINTPSEVQAGKTPMHVLKSGHERLIQLLLCSGSTVDARDHQGNTPLISACVQGEAGIARMLILQNANVLCRNDDNETPLHVLANAAAEDTSLASSLIKAGVNPHARNRRGNKAAEIARARGFSSTAEVLEKHILIKKARAAAAKNSRGKPRGENTKT